MEPISHFSHNHGLVFLQLPQGSQTPLCSACKSPTSGNVYACWQCSYFLHEQCFRASRSLKHPSHPLHPLTLMPFPTYPSRSFVCNSCNLMGDAYSYSCSECEFDIHVHCALAQNANPQNVNPQNVNSQQNVNPQNVNSQQSHAQPNATTSKPHFSHIPHFLGEFMKAAQQNKTQETEEEAMIRREREEELRFRRHLLAMQQVHNASLSCDLLGRIG